MGRIFKLSLDKENKLKEGSWEAYQKQKWYLVYFVFWKKKEENKCVRKKIVLLCEKCCSWKKCVQTNNMEINCV